MLTFHRHSKSGDDTVGIAIDHLVIAGWAGRDEAAIQHHIEELAAIGVPRPSSVPVFYRVGAATLTQTESLEALGPDSSGEVEPVIVAMADGLWLGIGSDHTDRKAETVGIALSKQLCGKVVGHDLWPLSELAGHWDRIEMRSWALIDGQRVPYQNGTLSALRMPSDLIARYGALQPGSLMFGGTLGAIGGIRPAARFEMMLYDPVMDRTMTHAYDIKALPIVA